MGSLQKFLLNGLSGKTPLIEFRRFRGKINIQRPQKLHYQRQLVTDLCKPRLPKPARIEEVCSNISQTLRWPKPDNPFERILARECLNWFRHSRMVAFYHLNPYPMEDQLKVYAALAKNGMYLRQYGIDVLRQALEGTDYEGVLPLFVSHTKILFSEKPQVGKLFSITKKAHPLVLLGGILEGKLLSKNELAYFSKISSISEVQSELCQVLESASSGLVEILAQQQDELVANLDSYVQMKQTGEESNTTSSDNSPDSSKAET